MASLWLGVTYALLAGLAWGLVFLAPLLLAEYSPGMLTFGRYVAFGIISLGIAWFSRDALKRLELADWKEALKLSLVGNIIYYLALSAAIQFADAPMPTMIIGTLPVVIAIATNMLLSRSNRQEQGQASMDRPVSYRQLAPGLVILLIGLLLVNHAESTSQTIPPNYLLGLGFAFIALVCWTWYPIRNSLWLKNRPQIHGSIWATVQGLTTLPLAMLGFISLTAAGKFSLGAQPEKYIALMFAIGLLASWVGTWCWNRASQLLPTALAGQLIVFETLAALLYAYLFRGRTPDSYSILGISLLVGGVLMALRVFSQAAPDQKH